MGCVQTPHKRQAELTAVDMTGQNQIKTKGAEGAVSIGSQKSLLQRNVSQDYSGFVEVMPWEDTVLAINELGTLIDDLQKQGDYAIEKWT